MMGIGLCWWPMVTSGRFRGGEIWDYLVVEVGHCLLTTTRQSGRKVRGAPDVAHLVVLVVKRAVRVPLG